MSKAAILSSKPATEPALSARAKSSTVRTGPTGTLRCVTAICRLDALIARTLSPSRWVRAIVCAPVRTALPSGRAESRCSGDADSAAVLDLVVHRRRIAQRGPIVGRAAALQLFDLW